MDKIIFNVKELISYLHCSESLIRKLVVTNNIPYFRVGKKILFEKEKIDCWINSNSNH